MRGTNHNIILLFFFQITIKRELVSQVVPAHYRKVPYNAHLMTERCLIMPIKVLFLNSQSVYKL